MNSFCFHEWKQLRRFTTLPFMWQEERNCPCWSEHWISSVAQLFCVALSEVFLHAGLVELWCFIYAFTIISVSSWDDTGVLALGRAQCSSLIAQCAAILECCSIEGTPNQKGHGRSGGRYVIMCSFVLCSFYTMNKSSAWILFNN